MEENLVNTQEHINSDKERNAQVKVTRQCNLLDDTGLESGNKALESMAIYNKQLINSEIIRKLKWKLQKKT